MWHGATKGSSETKFDARLPGEAGVRQEIVGRVGTVAGEAQHIEVHRDPTRLGVVMVEIDDGQDDVLALRALPYLRVGDELIVVGRVELEPIVELKRLVLAADPIHQPDEGRQTGRTLEIPGANLVFLRPRGTPPSPARRGRCSCSSKGGPVDPVARREGRGQDQTGDEGRLARRFAVPRSRCRACSARGSA